MANSTFIVTSLVVVGTIIIATVASVVYFLSHGEDSEPIFDLYGTYGQPTSCFNRCGDDEYSIGCQCNVECFELGNCCNDYADVCFSCTNRCTDPIKEGAPCQCVTECNKQADCCDDFLKICSSVTVVGNVSDEAIVDLSEKLYSLQKSNIASYVVINMQGHTTSSATDDMAPLPLFSNVSQKIFDITTVRLFEALKDNYNKDVAVAENNTAAKQAEVAAFLDAMADTPIMMELEQFLKEHQILNGSLRAGLEQIWFTPYSRNGLVLGSSGFEHVFIGELNNGNVDGYHNWINFFREEQKGEINYMGSLEYIDLGAAGYVFTDRFAWNGRQKSIGGGYIGTLPEFDLAMMSLCFYVRPNSLCPVQTNGRQYMIQTYDFNDKKLVGSAYPLSSWRTN